jgi:uncharacterized protein
MPPMPERLHLLVYDYVEDIAERRAPHREGHLGLVRLWHDDGRIVIGGAIGDPPHAGMIAFRVEDPSEIQAFVDADPYTAAGLVTSWRVEPWTVVT